MVNCTISRKEGPEILTDISGLTADLTALDPRQQTIVVTNRLAQTTVRYLTSIDPATGQSLAEELRTLASAEEYDLLMEDRGFTFFHLVQFLYEFAQTYADIPDPQYFCAGMGLGGGGLEVAPDQEVLSLVHLLTTALPSTSDYRSIGLLIQTLCPLMLSKVFTPDLFCIEVLPERENQLRINLDFAARNQVANCLKAFELEGDIGTFFLNSALHFQGTALLGLHTLVREAEHSIAMDVLIENRDSKAREEIQTSCSCAWTVAWKSSIQLNRLVDAEEILDQGSTIYEALHRKDLQYYLERIKTLEMQVQALEEGDRFHEMIGNSPQMHQVYRTIQQVAASDFTVLIRGETGTGKELVARAIHQSSPRSAQPFVAVNCAAFSETLLESELFGHEKGAFTGADRSKPGRFETASGGTLFLDEVGDIPLTTQVKLLRVIETRSFERVGGTENIQVDVRIVGATNRDLEALIETGEFREDFYFRLHVLPVNLPPLRDHPEDMPLLAQHFLDKSTLLSGKQVSGFSRGALARLQSHSWPGNKRELLNVIERAVVVYAQGPTLSESDIAQALGIQAQEVAVPLLNLRQRQILDCIQQEETGCGIDALMDCLQPATQGTGRSRRTLQNDLRKLAELGYLTWYKNGNARTYTITSQGLEMVQEHPVL